MSENAVPRFCWTPAASGWAITRPMTMGRGVAQTQPRWSYRIAIELDRYGRFAHEPCLHSVTAALQGRIARWLEDALGGEALSGVRRSRHLRAIRCQMSSGCRSPSCEHTYEASIAPHAVAPDRSASRSESSSNPWAEMEEKVTLLPRRKALAKCGSASQMGRMRFFGHEGEICDLDAHGARRALDGRRCSPTLEVGGSTVLALPSMRPDLSSRRPGLQRGREPARSGRRDSVRPRGRQAHLRGLVRGRRIGRSSRGTSPVEYTVRTSGLPASGFAATTARARR